MFNIVLHPRAEKFLIKIPKNDRKKIIYINDIDFRGNIY